jgi:hypothetical protein
MLLSQGNSVRDRADRGPALAHALLDGLIDLCLRRDVAGLRRPRLTTAAGSPLHLHGEGISACPLCGGPRRVYRIGGPHAAGRGHFCARCWQLDLVDEGGRPSGHATRRLEKFVRELPPAARPSSLPAAGPLDG